MRFFSLLFLFTLSGVVLLHAQTGSVAPSAAALARMENFEPGAIELVEESVVDLRPWLPPPGEQRMNDCTAWAIAYVGKTYLEARDQGWWHPRTPDRIFSPRFVYNQINRGKDEGSVFIDAIRLMRDKGAATLATEPYRPKDFLGEPTARALEEARLYPIHDGRLLRSGQDIRRALQRRQVVIFGAHVNPTFFSGKFTSYTRELFQKGNALRQANQPHGKHAMAIVGYDDKKESFLVQNSWGTRWGERGYCWIHYALFDEIRVTSEGDVFCNWAVTLLDVEEKVEAGPDGKPRLAALDLNTLAPKGHSDLVGYDEKSQRHRYVFAATLGGQRAALAQVKSVQWHWTDDTGQARQTSTDDAKNRFRLISATAANPLTLRGTVTLNDGSQRTIQGDVTGPNPKTDFRTAEIVFKNTYFGKSNDGRPLFWWEASLDLPLTDQGSVREVRWEVGRMNLREPRQVNTGFNGPPETERALGMTLEPDEISAEIHYKDGGIKHLKHRPVLDHPVRETPFIEMEAREMSTDAQGNTVYSWTLTLDRPRAWDTAIQKVTYELDPWLAEPVRDEGQVYRDFFTVGSSHRDFRARATVHFNDGRAPVSTERWIELGPKSKFATAERIELFAQDRYYGRINGQPHWVTTWKLIGDRQEITRLSGVAFRGIANDTAVWQPAANTDPAQGFAWTTHTAAPRTVDVRYHTAGGIERTLSRPHTPVALANDALALGLAVSEKPDSRNYTFTEYSHTFSAWPVGTEADLAKIVRGEYRYLLRGRLERARVDSSLLYWSGQTALDSVVDPGSEMEARFTFADGFEEIVRRTAHPGQTQTTRPEQILRVREVFWGYHADGTPQWLAELSVTGVVDGMQKAQRLQYTLTSPGIGEKPWVFAGEPDQIKTALIRGPVAIRATLTLDDGTAMVLENEARASTARASTPLQLHRWRSAGAGGKTTPVIALVGWESILRDIQEVTYQINGTAERVSWRGARGHANFGIELPATQGGQAITAEVSFKNGTRQTLSLPAATTPEPLGLTQDIRYWGDGQWEVDFHVTGPVEQRRAFYGPPDFVAEPDQPNDSFSRVSIHRLPARPNHTSRGLFKTGEHRLKELQYSTQPQEVLKLPGHAFATTGEQSKHLVLRLKRHPHQPASATRVEWIAALQGPEKLLSQVKEVRYTVDDKENFTVLHRWGELSDGFELHRMQSTTPLIRATAHLVNGTALSVQIPSE